MGIDLIQQVLQKQRGLTIRSTGHFAAVQVWAKNHSPNPAHRKMPVSSNVRRQNICSTLLRCISHYTDQRNSEMQHRTVHTSKGRKQEIFRNDDGTEEVFYFRRGRYNKWYRYEPPSKGAQIAIAIIFSLVFAISIVLALGSKMR